MVESPTTGLLPDASRRLFDSAASFTGKRFMILIFNNENRKMLVMVAIMDFGGGHNLRSGEKSFVDVSKWLEMCERGGA
jgi:hypothetical protein